MYYITCRQAPTYHQITLEEFLAGITKPAGVINPNTSNTRTYVVDHINDKIIEHTNIDKLVAALKSFNAMTEPLRMVDRHSLYSEFYIPKRTGGLRKIDAPNIELMNALRTLKEVFEVQFGALYHTSAFAYIRNRSTVDCMKRHQANESKWYGKTDFSNFFGSTTLDFTMKMLKMIYPFCVICENHPDGESELRRAIELAFLDGGLPQGTPISPMITNLIMIPVDHKLANGFRNFNNQTFVYTRYADDIQVSSRFNFNMNSVVEYINGTLQEFEAPFRIKPEKTRYGSSAGRNWNLGIMINANNEMTIGNKKKRQFEVMLHSFVLDTVNNKPWNLSDVQVLDGLYHYYKMVEGASIDRIVNHIGGKLGTDIPKLIKSQLK